MIILFRLFIHIMFSISLIYAEVDQRLVFDQLYSSILDKSVHLASDVVYELDFSRASTEAENPADWFSGKGFSSQFADKIKLEFENNGISFSTSRSSIAIWGKDGDIPEATKVRIEWGVSKYPRGANYENNKKYSAISLNVAFGREKFSSGFPFVPSAPYFFSLFPGEKEPVGKFYKYKYWKNTSRHVCVSSGVNDDELITTEFDLKYNFEKMWDKNMPTISGFLIAINSNAKSKAYIKKITFLK